MPKYYVKLMTWFEVNDEETDPTNGNDRNKIAFMTRDGMLDMGVDKIGETYANNHNIKCNIYHADWTSHGKSAGYKRNITMANNANALLAFWNGQSKGTKHMIDIANECNLKVRIVKI